MYAMIQTGGKQYRVEEGQSLQIELVGDEGDTVELTPIMLVDGETVLAKPEELSGVSVTAEVTGQVRGPKINGFTYKPKSNIRRRWGHRQNYNTVTITGITRG